ncbi:hypothetical protein EAE96_001034 [Botrytis aclada]|nr:hypothetical protein EAE96_001034 [Botrytis aclada]
MLLSSRATRILEEVKNGCCMLYGAEFFTEDEWVKIDALLHKGKYVFTNGPQKQLTDACEPSESKELVRIDDKAVSEPPSSTQADLQEHDGPSEDEPKSDALVTWTNNGNKNSSGSPSNATCFHCQTRPQVPENEARVKLPKPKYEASPADFARDYEPKKEEPKQREPARESDEPRIILTRSMASPDTQSMPIGPRPKKAVSAAQIGKSYRAINNFQPPPESLGGLQIFCGDKIKVKKLIGPKLCMGWNSNSGLFGSFPVSAIIEDDKRSSKKTDHGSSAPKKTGGFSMDEYDNRKTAEWADDDEDDILPPSTESQVASNGVEETKQVETLGGSKPAASANSNREINSESDSESAGIESRVSSLNTDHDEDVVNEQKVSDADYENKSTTSERTVYTDFNEGITNDQISSQQIRQQFP